MFGVVTALITLLPVTVICRSAAQKQAVGLHCLGLLRGSRACNHAICSSIVTYTALESNDIIGFQLYSTSTGLGCIQLQRSVVQ
jgi:hypothetical protein